MQERRLTIRIPYVGRLHYCASDDLLPGDGDLVNLSERGMGFLAREAHLAGERVTVSFSLPEQQDVLTASGEIRWSGERAKRGGRHRVGLTWLPLEEATQHRLTQFLYRAAQGAAQGPPNRHPRSEFRQLVRRRSGVTALLTTGLLVSVWMIVTLRSHNSDLQGVAQAQRETITRLERREGALQRELNGAREALRATSEDVAHLNEQAGALGRRAAQLHQAVAQFQASYHQLQQEREALIDRVVSLEQARAAMLRQVVPLDQLQVAIREAVSRRQMAMEREPQTLESLTAMEQIEDTIRGNGGFVVLHSPSMPDHHTPMRIRVHEPELPPHPSTRSARDLTVDLPDDPQ